MTLIAKGSFTVALVPQSLSDVASGSGLGRMSIDKQFSGDLVGTSTGEMLAAGSVVKGSAGYVALERVTGTLGARSGSFVLQHTGTMNRGTPSLSVTVVPDSGTDGLQGLSGMLTIDIVEGKHLYTFQYSLPD